MPLGLAPHPGAEGGEAGAAGDDRGDPEREPPPVEIDEETEAGEHQERDDDGDDDAEQDLLAEQRRLRDEPAGQPRESVLLALEGERAGDEQDGHEHQRDRRGDGDRERIEARGAAGDDLLVDLDRLRDRVQQVAGGAEVLGGEVAEADHRVELVEVGAVGG